MQHAIMIMAHKNMEQLCHLVEYFTHDCYVLIHLDKKFKVSKEERERLEAFYTGGATPEEDKPFYIRTVYNDTACSGEAFSDCNSHVHSHPDLLEASKPDKYTACLFKEIYNYIYFGIYSVRDKKIEEFEPFSLEDANDWADANGAQKIVPPQ